MRAHRWAQIGNWRTVVAAAGLAVVLLGARVAAAPSGAAVDIEHFKYGPQVVTVPVGATVTWVNRDEETHTVTSATGAFSSTGLANDETFTQTFTRPGTYDYHCALHPQMRATVVVK